MRVHTPMTIQALPGAIGPLPHTHTIGCSGEAGQIGAITILITTTTTTTTNDNNNNNNNNHSNNKSKRRLFIDLQVVQGHEGQGVGRQIPAALTYIYIYIYIYVIIIITICIILYYVSILCILYDMYYITL